MARRFRSALKVALGGHVLAAVQGEGGAGHEAGPLARQERDHVGDLLALAQAADRDARDDAGQHGLGHGGDHLGVDIAGADAR